MADLVVHKNFLVDTKPEAQKKWMQCQLQEKKSIVARIKQEIEDLLKGKIADLEGNLIMYEEEVKYLEAQLKKISST